MVITNLEILVDEVSPQVTPFSFVEVRTLCTYFTFRIQQPDRVLVQSRDGAGCGCQS
jgi:hypothetical protein